MISEKKREEECKQSRENIYGKKGSGHEIKKSKRPSYCYGLPPTGSLLSEAADELPIYPNHHIEFIHYFGGWSKLLYRVMIM